MDGLQSPNGDMNALDRAAVSRTLAYMAALKNVPLSPEERSRSVEGLLAQMNPVQLDQLTAVNREGLAARSKAVNAWLDVIAVSRIANVVASVEGTGGSSDPGVLAVTSQIVRKVEEGLADKTCVHWPDLGALVSSHYAGNRRGPTVGVREDGTVCTRWWLGMCDFHRDPKEGPANIEEKGERRLEEHWVEGRLHRPHADGPGMIYTHYKNFDLCGEEYFKNGKWHRPSGLGPAVTHWDRSGEPVMKLYYENGEHHRDPSAGPAWWHIHDSRTERNATGSHTEIKYAVRGQLHRDEQDGPAWIKRDNETGVLVTEEYWRRGELHRADGPASINRDETGKVIYEAWFRDGQIHRDRAEGPACTRRNLERRVTIEEFFEHGRQIDAVLGPAWVERGEDGKIVEELYWDGERMHARPAAPDFASNPGEGGQPETMKAGTHG